jgi:hypothetical protein
LKKFLPQAKALATNPTGYDTSVPFISQDDAVSVLHWKCLAKAHITNSQVELSAPCDSRGVLGVSPEHSTQMVNSSATWLTSQELLDLPLLVNRVEPAQ